MENSQLSSYTAKITSRSQTQTIKIIQKTLSVQSGLLDDSLANLNSLTPIDDLQALLDVWNEKNESLNSLDISISAETSKIGTNISTIDGIVASASEIIRRISIRKDTFGHLLISNASDGDEIAMPIVIEQETRRSIGDITFVGYQTLNTAISGKKKDISEVAIILEEKGSTPEKFSIADIQCFLTYINPQDIKLNLQYAYLLINDTEVDFSRAEEQFFLLRAMFGKRGKNRPKIEFEDFYNFWSEQEHIPLDWDAFGKVDDGRERAEFIHKIRNTVTNINNKVRKALGGTEDFLKARDNSCYFNPKLLNLKKSK